MGLPQWTVHLPGVDSLDSLNPRHPSLHFRLLVGHKDRFSVRVGIHYRALAKFDANTVTWVWIGSHAEYDRLVQDR